MDTPNTMISQHLEGFLLSARKLEEALGEEKKRSQKIAQEYLATRTTLENAVRELQNRLIQRENKLQAIGSAYQNLQANAMNLKQELQETGAREKTATTELAQYKSAWNEVLAREAQARTALIEYEKAKNTLNAQRNQIGSLEQSLRETNQAAATNARHAETYQRELQSALIRIQSAEAKYSQIQKELSVLSQSKRNADEEIARIEASMRERFRWELATEKERLRAELEKDSALDRERFREIARNQMRAEIERQTQPAQRAREAAEVENADLRKQLAAAEEKQVQNLESSERALGALKRDLALHQIETNNAQIKIETIRKDSNKALLVERLRHEDAIRALRAQIENLMERGIHAEAVDEIPDGVRVYTATPVAKPVAANPNAETSSFL